MSQIFTKNIANKEDAYNIKNEYAKKQEMGLLSFMQENCKYVTEEEQKELDEMNVDFSDSSGR